MQEDLKRLTLPELTAKIARERGSSVFVIEITHEEYPAVAVQTHATLDDRVYPRVEVLECLTESLRLTRDYYEIELAKARLATMRGRPIGGDDR